jgi:hypothetical protein
MGHARLTANRERLTLCPIRRPTFRAWTAVSLAILPHVPSLAHLRWGRPHLQRDGPHPAPGLPQVPTH